MKGWIDEFKMKSRSLTGFTMFHPTSNGFWLANPPGSSLMSPDEAASTRYCTPFLSVLPPFYGRLGVFVHRNRKPFQRQCGPQFRSHSGKLT